jgi:SHS2 domain-containing protein
LSATHWKTIELQATDREILLVDWLNELLYYTEMEGLLFIDFRIESISDASERQSNRGPEALAAAHLVAKVGAVQAPATRASIKAATFHNLEVVQNRDGWSTVITFDV